MLPFNLAISTCLRLPERVPVCERTRSGRQRTGREVIKILQKINKSKAVEKLRRHGKDL